jgi:hypothetical protein
MRGVGRSGQSRWLQKLVCQRGVNADQFQALQELMRERDTENGSTVGLPYQPSQSGEAKRKLVLQLSALGDW